MNCACTGQEIMVKILQTTLIKPHQTPGKGPHQYASYQRPGEVNIPVTDEWCLMRTHGVYSSGGARLRHATAAVTDEWLLMNTQGQVCQVAGCWLDTPQVTNKHGLYLCW